MIPIEAAWEHYGGRILGNGQGRCKANCPLHDDRNASAMVDLDTGKWTCYAGCGYGDLYDLIQKGEDCSFPEAKRIAKELFGDEQSPPEPNPLHTSKGTRPGRRNWKPPWLMK